MAGHTGDEDQLALVLVCRHGEGWCTRNAKTGATVDESGPKLTVARKMLADSLKSEVPGNLTGNRAAITEPLRSYQDRQVGIATANTGERRPGRSYVRCAFLVPDRRGTLRDDLSPSGASELSRCWRLIPVLSQPTMSTKQNRCCAFREFPELALPGTNQPKFARDEPVPGLLPSWPRARS